MIYSIMSILIIILVLVLMEIYVEAKIQLRKRIIKKLGVLGTITISLTIIVIIDIIVFNYYPNLRNDDLYKYAMLGFMVFFLPKRGDRNGNKSKRRI